MSRSAPELLRESLVHFDQASRYADGADLSPVVVDAICLRLAAGIEVLARLDTELRSSLFGDRWQLMWGMRNRIAHGYLLVDPEIVRRTVAVDLPAIIEAIGSGLEGR